MINSDIKTFVLLKYKILTSDSSTWHLCDTYPESVRKSWAWRCASDVEDLAKGHKKAEECIRIAKLYRDGLATEEELDKAWIMFHAPPTPPTPPTTPPAAIPIIKEKKNGSYILLG